MYWNDTFELMTVEYQSNRLTDAQTTKKHFLLSRPDFYQE